MHKKIFIFFIVCIFSCLPSFSQYSNNYYIAGCKAFKNKEFYKVDNFNKTLNTISTSAKNYKSKSLNLDALDEEDDDLL